MVPVFNMQRSATNLMYVEYENGQDFYIRIYKEQDYNQTTH